MRLILETWRYTKNYGNTWGFVWLCFVWLRWQSIFPYPSGLRHWHLIIAPVPVKQPWRIWANTSHESTWSANTHTRTRTHAGTQAHIHTQAKQNSIVCIPSGFFPLSPPPPPKKKKKKKFSCYDVINCTSISSSIVLKFPGVQQSKSMAPGAIV